MTLAAPGDQILGSVRENRFATLSGTSQAAAFVTGAAGLLEAANHRLTPAQIKNRLLYTADLDSNYDGKVAFGKLDVKRALSIRNAAFSIMSSLARATRIGRCSCIARGARLTSSPT